MKLVAMIGGAVLAVLSCLPARAADMTPVVQQPASSGYIPARFLWTGFYLGAAVGGGWGSATWNDPFAPATATASPHGFLVGALAGINYQIDSVVVGAEADFTGSWTNGSVVDSAGNNLLTKVFWTSTVTGRVGWAFDRLLIYGKGGAAFAYDRDTVTLATDGGQAIGSTYRAGWTIGGGLEYAVTDHWIARFEYDYLKFAAVGFQFSGTRNSLFLPPLNAGGTVGLTLNQIKVAIAYKF
jgi:outer membrane immunogenic protein